MLSLVFLTSSPRVHRFPSGVTVKNQVAAIHKLSLPIVLPVLQDGDKNYGEVWPEIAECWEFDWASRSDDN